MSIKFESLELKKEFIKIIDIINEYNNSYVYLTVGDYYYDDELKNSKAYFEKVKCITEKYTEDECYDLGYDFNSEILIIDNDTKVILILDEYENSVIECTIYELIILVKLALNSSIDEDGILTSNECVIIRTELKGVDDPRIYEVFPNLDFKFMYNKHEVSINVYTKDDIYIMKNYFEENYSNEYPLELYTDIFIKIKVNNNYVLSKKEIYEIFNVCAYKIFKIYNYKLDIVPRQLIYYSDDENEYYIDEFDIEINESLFGNGLAEILDMFNNAEGYDNDRSIVEYVKLIEYISATVIRKKLTQQVIKEIKDLKKISLIPNYIEGLEKIFLKNNKDTKNDSDKIKETIMECCNIEELAEYSPKFLKSLYKLKHISSIVDTEKEQLINIAKGDLAKSISNTRNNLSHAKINYKKKELECPKNEKEQFVVLLRNVCIQIIEWYSKTDDSIRVIEN